MAMTRRAIQAVAATGVTSITGRAAAQAGTWKISHHISQSTAQWIVALPLSNWVLLVIVLGFFLPPVSIILMTRRYSWRR